MESTEPIEAFEIFSADNLLTAYIHGSYVFLYEGPPPFGALWNGRQFGDKYPHDATGV